MRALGLALLLTGCSLNAEPAICRDPQSVSFAEESRVGSCDVVRNLALCEQTRGTFNQETCEVVATYACFGGVLATASYTFHAGEPAQGFEVFRRTEDACRVERTMIEANHGTPQAAPGGVK